MPQAQPALSFHVAELLCQSLALRTPECDTTFGHPGHVQRLRDQMTFVKVSGELSQTAACNPLRFACELLSGQIWTATCCFKVAAKLNSTRVAHAAKQTQ
eukprot:1216800-Alexandrium_andersonii.AAC.1